MTVTAIQRQAIIQSYIQANAQVGGGARGGAGGAARVRLPGEVVHVHRAAAARQHRLLRERLYPPPAAFTFPQSSRTSTPIADLAHIAVDASTTSVEGLRTLLAVYRRMDWPGAAQGACGCLEFPAAINL